MVVAAVPLREATASALDTLRGWGAAGPPALVALAIVAAVLCVPGAVITLGAGAAFGPLTGAAAGWTGASLGACAAFLLARHAGLREALAARLLRRPALEALDRAVGRLGLRVVLLTRLSPLLPFNLLNYAYGASRVSFREFAWGCLGMLPGSLAYAWAGAAAARLARAEAPAPAASRVLFWLGLVASVAVTVLVTRAARRELAARLAEPGEGAA